MLELVKLNLENYPLAVEMMEEWCAAGERIVPSAIAKEDYRQFDRYVNSLELKEPTPGLVADSTYFCLNTARNRFVGAVNIRHELNEALLLNGGHIGDGVRPSERKKGIGTQMVALALEECRRLHLDQVLMVCSRENIASAKTILKNGGVLENEVEVNGVMEQRYWITL